MSTSQSVSISSILIRACSLWPLPLLPGPSPFLGPSLSLLYSAIKLLAGTKRTSVERELNKIYRILLDSQERLIKLKGMIPLICTCTLIHVYLLPLSLLKMKPVKVLVAVSVVKNRILHRQYYQSDYRRYVN